MRVASAPGEKCIPRRGARHCLPRRYGMLCVLVRHAVRTGTACCAYWYGILRQSCALCLVNTRGIPACPGLKHVKAFSSTRLTRVKAPPNHASRG